MNNDLEGPAGVRLCLGHLRAFPRTESLAVTLPWVKQKQSHPWLWQIYDMAGLLPLRSGAGTDTVGPCLPQGTSGQSQQSAWPFPALCAHNP